MTATRRNVLAAGLAAGLGSGARAAAGPFKLVMLGDSLTAGYGLQRSQTIPVRLQAALLARGATVRIFNAGASGETSADLRGRLDFSVPAETNGVFVAIGGNDMLQGLPPRELRGNLDAILAALKSRRIRTALAGMRAAPNLGRAYQREFDAIFPALARAHGAPFYPFLLEGVALNPALNQSDGIHPNPAGAEIIAGRLAPFVLSAFAIAGAR